MIPSLLPFKKAEPKSQILLAIEAASSRAAEQENQMEEFRKLIADLHKERELILAKLDGLNVAIKVVADKISKEKGE